MQHNIDCPTPADLPATILVPPMQILAERYPGWSPSILIVEGHAIGHRELPTWGSPWMVFVKGNRSPDSWHNLCGRGGNTILNIRRAVSSDSEVLTSIAARSEASWGFDATFMNEFEKIYKVSEEFITSNSIFAAEEDGAVVGFYALVTKGIEATLEFMYIEPSKIGKGLGRMLWNHMISHCQECDIEVIQLVCGSEPKKFYLKMGAVSVGEVDSLVIQGRKVSKLSFSIMRR